MNSNGLQQQVHAFGDNVTSQAKRWIETVSSFAAQHEEVLCVELGKELIVVGALLGNGIGLRDPDKGLQPAWDCIAQFKQLALARIRELRPDTELAIDKALEELGK